MTPEPLPPAPPCPSCGAPVGAECAWWCRAGRRAARWRHVAPFVRHGRSTPGFAEVCARCRERKPWHALGCRHYVPDEKVRLSGV